MTIVSALKLSLPVLAVTSLLAVSGISAAQAAPAPQAQVSVSTQTRAVTPAGYAPSRSALISRLNTTGKFLFAGIQAGTINPQVRAYGPVGKIMDGRRSHTAANYVNGVWEARLALQQRVFCIDGKYKDKTSSFGETWLGVSFSWRNESGPVKAPRAFTLITGGCP